MRILLVNTSERTGGAAIAANRLMNALNHTGQEARMLVRDKTTQNNLVTALPKSPLNRLRFIMERAEIFAANHFKKHRLFEVDHASHGIDITTLPEFKKADVIHLHWVNQGMLSLNDIARILEKKKPLVWTLHDMWPCTGICHYARDCNRWLSGCGSCPILFKGAPRDLSYRTYLRKQEAFSKGTIQFVACSDWLTNIAKQAPLLHGNEISSIPNPINTHLYSPQDQHTARMHLGLPDEKYILLFVAYKATDPIKGINYFQDALRMYCDRHPEMKDRLHVVVVGREATLVRDTFPCSTTTFEYVSDDRTMRDLYNAATLLMMPTVQDNLPNTIVESMACGLPCIGFNVGGLPQMIENGVSGYLARHKDAADFARCIETALDDEHLKHLSIEARNKALRFFSEEAVAKQYTAIYEKAMQQR